MKKIFCGHLIVCHREKSIHIHVARLGDILSFAKYINSKQKLFIRCLNIVLF
jgi:hypothetical protein